MNLKSDKRQNIQLELDFSSSRAGEACETGREETESRSTAHDTESRANTNRLMEEACERENLKEALRQVKANKGSAGIDRMTVGQLSDYLKQHWPAIREQLLNGPVRTVVWQGSVGDRRPYADLVGDPDTILTFASDNRGFLYREKDFRYLPLILNHTPAALSAASTRSFRKGTLRMRTPVAS